MKYINPYLLLNIEPGGLFDTPKYIKQRRRELLADVALDGTLRYDSLTLDRATILRVLNDLDNESYRRFHAQILRDDELHGFLRFGTSYRPLKLAHIPENAEFSKFLSPFLIERFAESLRIALSEGDVQAVICLIKSLLPLSTRDIDLAYRPARNYFRSILNSLEEKRESLKASADIRSIIPVVCELQISGAERPFNPFILPSRVRPLSLFVKALISEGDIEALNAFPEQFQDLRNLIANCLDGIGVFICNELDEEEISELVFECAVQIRSGTQDHERIKDNVKIVRGRINRRRISQIEDQLKGVADGIRVRSYNSPNEITTEVLKIFDASGLNRVSSRELDTSIIGLSKQMTEIAWLLATSYFSPGYGIQVIDRCLELRLTIPSVGATLRNDLREARAQLEESTDTIIHPIEPAKPTKRTLKDAKNDTSDQQNGDQKPQNDSTRDSKRIDINWDPMGSVIHAYSSEEGIVDRLIQRLRNASQFEIAFIVVVTVVSLTYASICLLGQWTRTSASPTVASAADTKPQNQTRQSAYPVSDTNVATDANIPVGTMASTQPSETVRPETGTVLRTSGGWGTSSFKVTNLEAVDSIVRVFNVHNDRLSREIYLRASSTGYVSGIASGDYEVLFSTGYDYSPGTRKFLTAASYQKFEGWFTFSGSTEANGSFGNTIELTLQKVSVGRLRSNPISESEFNSSNK